MTKNQIVYMVWVSEDHDARIFSTRAKAFRFADMQDRSCSIYEFEVDRPDGNNGKVQ